MQEKYGFVYVWMDKKKGRFYVGSHWGHEKDGYVCSSRWMRNTYKRRPEDFKRRIVFRTSIREDLLPEEGRWLQMIKWEELGVRYYNLNATTLPGHWSSDERSRMTVGQKIAAAPGRAEKIAAAQRGRTVPEERKKRISESVKKTMTPEHRALLAEKSSGWKHSAEAKAKIIQAGRRPCPPEVRAKIAESNRRTKAMKKEINTP